MQLGLVHFCLVYGIPNLFHIHLVTVIVNVANEHTVDDQATAVLKLFQTLPFSLNSALPPPPLAHTGMHTTTTT